MGRVAETEDVVEAAYRGVRDAGQGRVEDATDLGASALAAVADPGDAGRALLAVAGGVLRECRARGWLPADLVRMVRRELGEAHVRLAVDLLAAEGRDRSATDARWPAQLTALGAVVWWEGDGFLDEYGRRERTSRFAAATVVLEVLRLFGRLPAVTPLGAAPAPGATGRPRAGGMLGRIRALLAKAESTGFPEEAEALTAKAQHLMARHSIDEALVAGEAAGGGPGACRIGVDQPYEAAKALLLDAVATANRCQAVWSGDVGFSTVVGFEPDLEAVELLYTSLLVQAHAAMQAGGRSRSKDFRQSFLIAYAARIGERLAVAAEEAEHDPGLPAAERLLPVLAARDVAVRETAERMFPATTTHRLRGRDAEGWQHGEQAADRAALGRSGRAGRTGRS